MCTSPKCGRTVKKAVRGAGGQIRLADPAVRVQVALKDRCQCGAWYLFRHTARST